jgi:hypothetical protein
MGRRSLGDGRRGRRPSAPGLGCRGAVTFRLLRAGRAGCVGHDGPSVGVLAFSMLVVRVSTCPLYASSVPGPCEGCGSMAASDRGVSVDRPCRTEAPSVSTGCQSSARRGRSEMSARRVCSETSARDVRSRGPLERSARDICCRRRSHTLSNLRGSRFVGPHATLDRAVAGAPNGHGPAEEPRFRDPPDGALGNRRCRPGRPTPSRARVPPVPAREGGAIRARRGRWFSARRRRV